MTYVRDERDLESCQACGSGRLLCTVGLELDVCLDCWRTWERLPAGEPYTIDGEMLPFKVPCATCAFRGKSPERLQENGEYWRDLQQSLSMGGEFYCHAGVPFESIEKTADGMPKVLPLGDRPFEYPRVERSIDLAGECHPYKMYDKTRMRLCRGYLNAFVGRLMKEFAREQA